MSVKITWLGHACYKFEYGGNSAVIDPYMDYVPGLPKLEVEAGEVYASHTQHEDHGWFEAVTIVPEAGESPFKVTTIDCYHDEEQGALRGENKITIFEVAGKKFVHCGDLGHMLSDEQIAAIKGCDVLMIPIGGFYTIEPETAKEIMVAADPKITVPMHYRVGDIGFDVLKTPQDFADMVTDRPVEWSDGPVIEVGDVAENKVVVLKFGETY